MIRSRQSWSSKHPDTPSAWFLPGPVCMRGGAARRFASVRHSHRGSHLEATLRWRAGIHESDQRLAESRPGQGGFLLASQGSHAAGSRFSDSACALIQSMAAPTSTTFVWLSSICTRASLTRRVLEPAAPPRARRRNRRPSQAARVESRACCDQLAVVVRCAIHGRACGELVWRTAVQRYGKPMSRVISRPEVPRPTYVATPVACRQASRKAKPDEGGAATMELCRRP